MNKLINIQTILIYRVENGVIQESSIRMKPFSQIFRRGSQVNGIIRDIVLSEIDADTSIRGLQIPVKLVLIQFHRHVQIEEGPTGHFHQRHHNQAGALASCGFSETETFGTSQLVAVLQVECSLLA